uniref:DNA-directed RNA polymerase n=1 Tax=Trichogramma kaykai TaxID=54128 RepID=A0ABD2WB50_9HYME
MQLEALDKASIRKNDIPFHVMGTDDPRNCPISKNNGVAEIPEQLNSITHQINYSAIDDSDESDNSCDEVFEDNFDAQDWFYSDEIEEYSSDDDTNEIDSETVRVVINEESFLSSSFLSSKLQLILSYWAIDHNISHSAITDLLHSIKGDLPDLTELPYNARTLLKTPKFTGDIDIMENGQYCHFGMKTCLEKIVLNSKNHNESDEEIKLMVNIDGAPIVEDCRKYGLLENFSAFRFENHLRQIKKMLRKGDRPLSQLVRRTAEIDFLKVNGDVSNFDGKVIFTKEHAIGPIIRGVTVIHQFSMAKFKNFKLNCGDDKNNCVQLRNGSIVLVKNFVTLNDDKKSFIGIELKTIGNVYEYPCASNLLGTFEVKDENNQLKFWSIDDIVCKMCKFDFEKKTIVVPMLHTILTE